MLSKLLCNSLEYCWFVDAMRLICWSRDGLTQDELSTIMRMMGYVHEVRMTSFNWAIFRTVTNRLLYEAPGGVLRFKSQFVREVFHVAILGMSTKCMCHTKTILFARLSH